MHKIKWPNSQKIVPSGVATYPSAGGRCETRGCVFHKRNTRGVATNVYLRKTSEKPEKT